MTLRVVNVPNPPAGQDWSTVVPGNFLYDVTGVNATLTTASLPVTTIADASGNGNDGTYLQEFPPFGPVFIPGLVVGNDAVQAQGAPANHNVSISGPSVVGWDASFAIVWWEQTDVIVGSSTFYKYLSDTTPGAPSIDMFQQTGAGLDYLEVSGVPSWRSVPGSIPNDGAPRMLAVMFDHNTGTLELYLNGTLLPWDVTGTAPAATAPPAGTFQLGNGGLFSAEQLDELSIYRTSFLPAFFADLFSKQGSFAAYNAAALAPGPKLYWHFAPNPAPTGRTPALEVTDGTTTVDRIGDGFPAVLTPGPYQFSWQPRVPANTQTPAGTLTLVGMPPLVLPAGYVLGVRTPDLRPGDQWSDIAVWWDDALQSMTIDLPAYVYPPGAFYTYRQIGVTP